MQITIRNKEKNIPTKVIREAANFYSKKLISNRLSKNIKLTISIAPLQSIKGYCEWLDKPVKGRNFNIVLSNRYKQKEALITLAHEMVHLKQFAIGELSDGTLRNKPKWKKQELNEDKIDYYDLPYEIEAYGRERGLYLRFIEAKAGIPAITGTQASLLD